MPVPVVENIVAPSLKSSILAVGSLPLIFASSLSAELAETVNKRVQEEKGSLALEIFEQEVKKLEAEESVPELLKLIKEFRESAKLEDRNKFFDSLASLSAATIDQGYFFNFFTKEGRLLIPIEGTKDPRGVEGIKAVFGARMDGKLPEMLLIDLPEMVSANGQVVFGLAVGGDYIFYNKAAQRALKPNKAQEILAKDPVQQASDIVYNNEAPHYLMKLLYGLSTYGELPKGISSTDPKLKFKSGKHFNEFISDTCSIYYEIDIERIMKMMVRDIEFDRRGEGLRVKDKSSYSYSAAFMLNRLEVVFKENETYQAELKDPLEDYIKTAQNYTDLYYRTVSEELQKRYLEEIHKKLAGTVELIVSKMSPEDIKSLQSAFQESGKKLLEQMDQMRE